MTESGFWAPVPGFNGYFACREGYVRGPRKVLKGYSPDGKYLRVLLRDMGTNSERVMMFIHRVILLTFVGPCPVGMEVRHLNGDSTDNRLENLKYGTHSENMQDTVRHGTHNTAGKSKSLCPHGHPYEGDNLYISPKGDKRCRECARNLVRKLYKPVENPKPNFQSSKTECAQGHPYDEENTGRSKDGKKRWCRACARNRASKKR